MTEQITEFDIKAPAKSLRDYLNRKNQAPKKKFRISYNYMDLNTHQDVMAVNKAEALKIAKSQLLDPKYMKNTRVQEIMEAFEDVHWNKHSKNIISAALRLVAQEKTAAARRELLTKIAKTHKVSFNDLYNAIIAKTGADYFSKD